MAKLPKYLKTEIYMEENSHSVHKIFAKVTIKKWSMPFFIFKCLKERFNLKWYHWLLYPYLCFKLIKNGGES